MPEVSRITWAYLFKEGLLEALQRNLTSEDYIRISTQVAALTATEINHERIKQGLQLIEEIQNLNDDNYNPFRFYLSHIFKRENIPGCVQVRCNMISPYHGGQYKETTMIGTEAVSVYSDILQFYSAQLDPNANILILDGSVWGRRKGDMRPVLNAKLLTEKVRVLYPHINTIADVKYIVIPMHDDGIHWRGSLFCTQHNVAYLTDSSHGQLGSSFIDEFKDFLTLVLGLLLPNHSSEVEVLELTNGPEQRHSNDCALFSILTSVHLSRIIELEGFPLKYKPSWGQQSITPLRKQLNCSVYFGPGLVLPTEFLTLVIKGKVKCKSRKPLLSILFL